MSSSYPYAHNPRIIQAEIFRAVGELYLDLTPRRLSFFGDDPDREIAYQLLSLQDDNAWSVWFEFVRVYSGCRTIHTQMAIRLRTIFEIAFDKEFNLIDDDAIGYGFPGLDKTPSEIASEMEEIIYRTFQNDLPQPRPPEPEL